MPKHKLKYNHQVGFDDLGSSFSPVTWNDRQWEAFDDNLVDEPWTDEDEAALEEYEDNKRRKLAEQQEY